ncbi:MAG: bifunctional UDP-N-acetylglucosamine diphosphorylase/glucosamine-1-phosphate N-acetyltransferase GlmU [Acidobacteriota bacterium]|nr:bifunctional UDP-N-acetylglucosamine diphosphorylase/glucosamine-1-phosphate N-acetyltransferase GlmU [Acidobacteriota bacterium]
MMDTHIVILAAGKGTRMRSSQPKVLHRLAGLPLIAHVLRAAAPLAPRSTTIVIGHGGDRVREALAAWPGLQYAVQEEQLGTAHALQQAESRLAGATGALLVLSGDVPRLSAASLTRLVGHHVASGAAVTVLTAVVDRPYGYGRIVRIDGRLARIVEERDAAPAERAIREINSGIYVFSLDSVFDALRAIDAHNAQGEHYLTDIVAVYRHRGARVETVVVEDAGQIQGINSRSELAEAGTLVRQQKNEELMAAGVTIEDPATTYVDQDVEVGPDTVLHPFVILEGRTTIGRACEIHAGTRIVNSTLADGVTVLNHCLIVDSRVETGASVGPFAHLRGESTLAAGARVGNFVELKKTVLGPGSKAMHHAYLGDATIGAKVNVGAGTITCNYDGERKHPTVIEDHAFIGSDSQLIAPVTVGQGAYVAAGSSITDDVPAGALAIARGRQVNKPDWAAKKASGSKKE